MSYKPAHTHTHTYIAFDQSPESSVTGYLQDSPGACEQMEHDRSVRTTRRLWLSKRPPVSEGVREDTG